MSSFAEYLKRQLKSTSNALGDTWTNTAQTHQWDESLHSAIKVVPHNNGVALSYPSDLHETIISVEYGDGAPPRAAMRNFKEQAKPEVNKAVYKAYSEFLESKGLF